MFEEQQEHQGGRNRMAEGNSRQGLTLELWVCARSRRLCRALGLILGVCGSSSGPLNCKMCSWAGLTEDLLLWCVRGPDSSSE